MLTVLIRRFKGLGVAIVVLALSAGVVFAAAPSFVPVSSHANPAANAGGDTQDPTEEPTEEPTEQAADDATEQATDDATETPTAAAPLAAPADAPDATGAPEDTHGALVSAAAQLMPLPDGFANRGAFVSCVAHMKGETLATVTMEDLAALTTDDCATDKATPPGQAKSQAAKTQAQDKAAAGKAKGQAKAAEAKAKHQG
jgi:hypothetical protein